MILKSNLAIAILFCSYLIGNAQSVKLSSIVGLGWANNSVNAVIFRKNSLVTFKGYQYTAYYDQDQHVVLAKRASASNKWEIKQTPFKGDATDAHKSISIIIDGVGYLHIAWGQHNNPLNYSKSVNPESLILAQPLVMTGDKEKNVSYPEFYKLPDGDLLFFYRDGASGNGNLVLNRYNLKQQRWIRIQDNLIDGQGKRSAYWQITLDNAGTIHLSWVWRESPDVASNHDMCYACSADGGISWQQSNGSSYALPITASSAEYVCHIPQKSELINQTAMFADSEGHPFIATYWRDSDQTVPQYHLLYHIGKKWVVNTLNFRKTAFSLSGGGTKSIPISRPQIIAWKQGNKQSAALIYRDAERGSKVSIAVNRDLETNNWQLTNLTNFSVGAWEPTYDTELWKNKQVLNLFIQQVTQVDGEGHADIPPAKVQVLEWKP